MRHIHTEQDVGWWRDRAKCIEQHLDQYEGADTAQYHPQQPGDGGVRDRSEKAGKPAAEGDKSKGLDIGPVMADFVENTMCDLVHEKREA
jgi:hypothetical protein